MRYVRIIGPCIKNQAIINRTLHAPLDHILLNSQESKEYDKAISPCHQRSADRIVAGALKNGGLYIKLGQGLSTFNQVLPRQFTETLKSLQDKVNNIIDKRKLISTHFFVQALAREFREVS